MRYRSCRYGGRSRGTRDVFGLARPPPDDVRPARHDRRHRLGRVGLVVQRVVDEPDLASVQLGDPLFEDNAVNRRPRAADALGQRADRDAAPVPAEDALPLLFADRLGPACGKIAACGCSWSCLRIVWRIVIGERFIRRATRRAISCVQQWHISASRRARRRISSRSASSICEKFIPRATWSRWPEKNRSTLLSEESDPPLAVGEHEPPRRQPLAPPALDRLAGDVEPFGHVIDRRAPARRRPACGRRACR